MSTTALLIGLQVEASTTVRRRSSGVPGFPSVMLRRTFSPGTKYGPSVSSGVRTQEIAPDATAAGPDPAPAADAASGMSAAAIRPPAASNESRRVVLVVLLLRTRQAFALIRRSAYVGH